MNIGNRDRDVRAIDGVQPFVRRDDRGRAVVVGAIDEDDRKIRALADRLQRAGYGVLRQRTPRAGRIHHRMRATWAGPGEPPEDPFAATEDASQESNRPRSKP